jgi:hypothetical protein
VDLRLFVNWCFIQDDNPDDNDVLAPHFAGQYKQKFSLYIYAPISHLLYHLGPMAFEDRNWDVMTLTDVSSSHWH